MNRYKHLKGSYCCYEKEMSEWVFEENKKNDPDPVREQTDRINVREGPAQSPDLNPIENMWVDILESCFGDKTR